VDLWLDTIQLQTVEEAQKFVHVAGVTTNPSLLSKSKNVKKTLEDLLKAQKGPVAVQVTRDETALMIEEGLSIFHFSKRCIVKVPVTKMGLAAIRILVAKKIPVMATGILTPLQALLASEHGASYIAPYYSHMGEMREAHLEKMCALLQVNHLPTKILAASVKTVEDFLFCASLGIDAVTIKEELYQSLVATNPQTEQFNLKFKEEWQQDHGNHDLNSLLK
jgi:TalC/MipB family fructose-6-phosphate aldolase